MNRAAHTRINRKCVLSPQWYEKRNNSCHIKVDIIFDLTVSTRSANKYNNATYECNEHSRCSFTCVECAIIRFGVSVGLTTGRILTDFFKLLSNRKENTNITVIGGMHITHGPEMHFAQ